MIADVTLRWVVTVLFALGAAECVLAIASTHRRPVPLIGRLLHLVMAVAMAVMAWPRGAELPTAAPMVFFAAAAAWFAGVTLTTARSGRLVEGYHTLMMAAMAWMYAVMTGAVLPGQAAHGTEHTMSGMGHAAGYPMWITAVNWWWTVVFAVAAPWWLWRYFASRRAGTAALSVPHLGALCQALMAAGMAIMFGVML